MKYQRKSSKKYKRDILDQLRNEKDKLEHTKFDDMFDFSNDFNCKSLDLRNAYSNYNDEKDNLKLSTLDYGMQEVTELKRLLYLTKVKLKQDNKNSFQNLKSKGIHLKKKLNTRKINIENKTKILNQGKCQTSNRNRIISDKTKYF